MFYDFHDLSKHGISPRGLPPEAMLLQLSNKEEWRSLEEMVDGFETLTVTGRELLAPKLTWSNPTGSDGGFITNAQLEQRQITVKYRLQADSDREYRDKFTELNTLLSKKMLTFKFNDDPNYYWQGTLSSAEVPEAGTNDVISSFTMTCPDPYKWSLMPVDYSGNSKVTINGQTQIPTLPEYILYTPANDTDNIVLTATDDIFENKTIRLEGAFKAGETIKVVPLSVDNDNVYVYNIHSGENIADTMTFDSDIEDFTLRKDSVVTASPSGKLEISFREKAL